MFRKLLALFLQSKSVHKVSEISSNEDEPVKMSDDKYYQLAIEQICFDITFESNVVRDEVYRLFEQKRGNATKELIERNLNFKWITFDKWLAFFEDYGSYPYMWKRCVNKRYFFPKNMEEVCDYLTVKDMKDILKTHGYPIPVGKRNELVCFFKEHIRYDDIQNELKIVMTKYGWNEENPYCKLKLILLEHSIFFRANALRDNAEYKALGLKSYLSFTNDGCIEEEIVRNTIKPRCRNGIYEQLPPYFPGGRCILIGKFSK